MQKKNNIHIDLGILFYLNRTRLRWFFPFGKETKVMRTPVSTSTIHSLGSSSSTKTMLLKRPAGDSNIGVPAAALLLLEELDVGVEVELPQPEK